MISLQDILSDHLGPVVLGEEIKWWNFALPVSIEGSALFSPVFFKIPNNDFNDVEVSDLHKQSHQSLKMAILESTEKAQNGQNVNTPLETILSRQGDSELPPQFKQKIQFYVDVVGIKKVGSDKRVTAWSTIEWELPFAEGHLSTERQDPKTGIAIKLEGRFFGNDPGFVFIASDEQGRSVSIPLEFSKDELNEEVREIDGKKVMVNDLFANAVGTGEASLPGRGDSDEITIEPSEAMSPSILVGE